jgi:hypothetical protein
MLARHPAAGETMSDPLARMADFDLSDEQRHVRSVVKGFAEK